MKWREGEREGGKEGKMEGEGYVAILAVVYNFIIRLEWSTLSLWLQPLAFLRQC